MARTLKGASSVLFALFTATAWAWTTVLKDLGWINDIQRAWALGILTLLLAIQQTYLMLPKPANRGLVEARRPVTQQHLSTFLVQYYETLKKARGANTTQPAVRVNVMLPTRRLRGLLGTRLRIYYVACPSGILYGDGELTLEWGKGEGTCGYAWAHKVISPYDSSDPQLSLPAKRLSPQQLQVVGTIGSTLSLPIMSSEGAVLGIMNLDSKQNVSDTLFSQTAVYTLAEACARELAAQCFSDGVAA